MAVASITRIILLFRDASRCFALQSLAWQNKVNVHSLIISSTCLLSVYIIVSFRTQQTRICDTSYCALTSRAECASSQDAPKYEAVWNGAFKPAPFKSSRRKWSFSCRLCDLGREASYRLPWARPLLIACVKKQRAAIDKACAAFRTGRTKDVVLPIYPRVAATRLPIWAAAEGDPLRWPLLPGPQASPAGVTPAGSDNR